MQNFYGSVRAVFFLLCVAILSQSGGAFCGVTAVDLASRKGRV
jgi:hypothetical protein